MKELSVEEKAKAYDKAIKKAAALYKASEPMSGCNVIIETLFPELAESEDEKIKNRLIKLIKMSNEFGGFALHKWEADEMLTWLEKQAEHANFLSKIQVGDKVTRNEDGVLVNLSQLKRVAKPRKKQCEQKLEMKSAEESLGIDSDTYNKIVDECIFGEQKPEENKGNIGGISSNWSEEDEYKYNTILHHLDLQKEKYKKECNQEEQDRYQCLYDWLKSLRPQNHWKPSDEQMMALLYHCSNGSVLTSLYNDLNKLKKGE